MTFQRKELGVTGEDLAAEFLINKGYQVLERNLKTKYGEVDILALAGQTTVIVEVKTKTSLSFGLPVEMVGPRKQRKLRLLATALAVQRKLVDYRIDVVSVDLSNPRAVQIEHIIAAC